MKQSTITVTESTTIARPIGEVFATLTEPQSAQHWISLVFDAELNEPGPIVAGSSAWYMVKILGRRFRIEGEWLRYDAPFESVFQTTISPINLHVTYRCHATTDGTHAEITAILGSAMFFGVTSGTIKKVFSSSFRHDLDLLKTYLESAPRLFSQINT